MQRSRRWIVGLVAALSLLVLYVDARIAWLAVHEPLGRDQGILLYVGYALSRGARDYVDMHDINGPFTHLLWFLLYKVAGNDELPIRVIEFLISAVVFFGVGAALPGLTRSEETPAPIAWRSRVFWGLVSSAVLWADFLRYSRWEHTQRDSMFNLFILGALALQLWALTSPSMSERARLVVIASAGALAVAPGFGKPPSWLFTLALFGGLCFERKGSRVRRCAAFLIGAALGCIPIVWFVVRYGDARAMLALAELGRLAHYYIWRQTLISGWNAYGYGAQCTFAAFTAGAMLLLGAARLFPRRSYALLGSFVAGIVALLVQGKMFPYHLMPITSTACLLWVMTALVLSEQPPRWLRPASCLAIFAALAFTGLSLRALLGSNTAHAMTPERLAAARSFEGRTTVLPRLYNGPVSPELDEKVGGDYYPFDLRQAGEFIRSVTTPDERVQVWGNDVYLLLFAERLTATPFLYAAEIDLSAALRGGPGGRPSKEKAAELREREKASAKELFERVQAAPPAAFVFLDRQPFAYAPDSVVDFGRHCRDAYGYVKTNYTMVRRFGTARVFLRNDLRSRAPTD